MATPSPVSLGNGDPLPANLLCLRREPLFANRQVKEKSEDSRWAMERLLGHVEGKRKEEKEGNIIQKITWKVIINIVTPFKDNSNYLINYNLDYLII